MGNRCLFGSLLVLLGWAVSASAQGGLGPPTVETILPPLQGSEFSIVTKPKLANPVPSYGSQTMPGPMRAARLLPPRNDDAPTIDLARMVGEGGYSLAEITAAKIRLEESQASARRAAVKYLALVDVRYYPEAEASLIAALRTDRSELVRFEAAAGLANCHFLSDRLIEALNITALGLNLDGNLTEASELVRDAARTTLQRCAARGLCLPPLAAIGYRVVDWPTTAPFAMQPVTGLMPASPTAVPRDFISPATQRERGIEATVSQRERDIAATVSTQPEPVKSSAPSRPLLQFWQNLTGREPSRDDTRLRGLGPLGADNGLAIPAPWAAGAMPGLPYNYR